MTKTAPVTTPVLAGQVAAVTGAGRGIGRAVALKLAELGAQVVVCGRSRDALEQTAVAIKEAGGKTSAIQCDVTDRESVESLGRQVHDVFKRLDILVNNAGIFGASGRLQDLPPEEWEQILNTNLRGVYYCIRSLAPLMIATMAKGAGGGHIINISALAGKNALPNGAAYAASKWGLNGLTYSLAEELRGHNIRVAVICPGSVNTEFGAHSGKNAEKMLQASDVAHAVAMMVTQAPQSFASEILLRPTQKP